MHALCALFKLGVLYSEFQRGDPAGRSMICNLECTVRTARPVDAALLGLPQRALVYRRHRAYLRTGSVAAHPCRDGQSRYWDWLWSRLWLRNPICGDDVEFGNEIAGMQYEPALWRCHWVRLGNVWRFSLMPFEVCFRRRASLYGHICSLEADLEEKTPFGERGRVHVGCPGKSEHVDVRRRVPRCPG